MLRSILMALQRVGFAHPRIRRLLAVTRNAVPESPRLLVVEGAWAHDILLSTGTPVELFLFAPDAIRSERARTCAERMAKVAEVSYEISARSLTRLSSRDRPDGLLSLVHLPTWNPATWPAFGESALVLVADGIEYAGNLGTLIRTADACRASCLVLTNRQVRLTHPRVFAASRGTVLSTPVLEFDTAAEASVWLSRRGVEVFLADPAAVRSYRTCAFADAPTAVVVGSEGRGVSDVWYEGNATTVSIPMLGLADSLNVAASAAILLYEARARKSGW
jgi:TrmH family RNA methyltransferase